MRIRDTHPVRSVRQRLVRVVLLSSALLAATLVAVPSASATDASFTGTVSTPATASSPKTAVHSLKVTEAGTVSASLDWADPAANLTLVLKAPDGTVLQTAATRNKPETVSATATAAGTYKLNVIAVAGSTAYTLAATFPGTTAPPTGALARYDSSFGFNGPAKLYAYGMDWDASDGSVLVGDYWNYRVKRFTATGQTPGGGLGGSIVSVTKPAGELGGTAAPYDVEADQFDRGPDGRATWWSADQESSRIVQFSHDGTWLQTIGLGGGGTDAQHPGASYAAGCGAGKTDIPTHLYVDPEDGEIYVSDPRCRAVYRFSHTGQYLGEFDWKPFTQASGVFTPIPRGLAKGPDGNIYVVEHNSRSVVVFDEQGRYLRKTAKQNDMNDPRGLDIDPRNGDVVVVAAYFNEIFKFRADGTFLKKWGTVDGTPGGREFDAIRFPAVDNAGNIYVGETWGTRAPDGSYTGYQVYKFTDSGQPLPWATPSGPPPDGGYNQPNGLAIDSRDELFVVDTFEQRVQAFDTTSTCVSAASCPAYDLQFGSREPAGTQSKGFGYPRGLTYGAERDLVYVGDNNNAVLAWTPQGQFVRRFGQQGKGVGQFSGGVQGLRAEGGTIYTTDVGNCRLSLWDEAASVTNTNGLGTLKKAMGSCGTGVNQMSAPRGVAVGPGSSVYVAETGSSRISRWDTTTSTAVTYKPRCDGVALKNPWGITWDPQRSWLYIGDVGNARIVRMSPDGATCQVVTTGLDVPEGSLKGTDYLEFDSAGRLYASDNNRRVYRFTLTG